RGAPVRDLEAGAGTGAGRRPRQLLRAGRRLDPLYPGRVASAATGAEAQPQTALPAPDGGGTGSGVWHSPLGAGGTGSGRGRCAAVTDPARVVRGTAGRAVALQSGTAAGGAGKRRSPASGTVGVRGGAASRCVTPAVCGGGRHLASDAWEFRRGSIG